MLQLLAYLGRFLWWPFLRSRPVVWPASDTVEMVLPWKIASLYQPRACMDMNFPSFSFCFCAQGSRDRRKLLEMVWQAVCFARVSPFSYVNCSSCTYLIIQHFVAQMGKTTCPGWARVLCTFHSETVSGVYCLCYIILRDNALLHKGGIPTLHFQVPLLVSAKPLQFSKCF